MIQADFFTAGIEKVDLNNVIHKAVELNSDILSDQITNQLDKGLDGKGNSLGEYANFDYKGRWKPVDLRLTGDFRNSIKPQTFKDFFEMTATDPKTEMLTQRYGDAIIDLSDAGLETAVEYIKEDMKTIFIDEIKK